ncbi:uncharacterized protein [Dysidea avara]|uniref:uncharacterized protein isoform X8 n=1 Tax=Dysidea avara TaxID=196820 RepID=UPI003329EE49
MLSFLAIGCLTLLRLFICMHITDLCPSILSTHHSVPLKLCTISFIFAVDRLAIASRLSKRVSAVNNQIKKMLRSFNEGLPVEDHTIWEAAINIHRNSYTASLASIATSIPIEVKREAVQKFRTAKRSLEEIALLKDEMRNCLEYYQRQIASLKRSQEEIHLQLHEQEKDVEKLSGCYCWISRKILIFSTKLTDLLSLFRNIVPEVIPPSMGTSEASTENHFPLTSYTDNSSSCFHFHSNETDEDPSVSGAVGNRTEDVQPRMNTPVSRAVGNRTEDDQPRVYITVSGAVGNRTEDDQPRVNNTVGGAVGNRTEDGRPRVNTTVGGAVGNRTGDGQPRVNTTVGGAVSNRTGDGQPRVNTTVGGAVGNRTGDGQPRVNTTVGGAVGNRTGDGQPRVNTTVSGAVGNRTGDGRPRVNTTVGGAVGNRTGDGRPRVNTTVSGAVGNRTTEDGSSRGCKSCARFIIFFALELLVSSMARIDDEDGSTSPELSDDDEVLYNDGISSYFNDEALSVSWDDETDSDEESMMSTPANWRAQEFYREEFIREQEIPRQELEHFISSNSNINISNHKEVHPSRPVGSFMGRNDLKEYAENLLRLSKKELSCSRTKKHFAFNVHKTSRRSTQ